MFPIKMANILLLGRSWYISADCWKHDKLLYFMFCTNETIFAVFTILRVNFFYLWKLQIWVLFKIGALYQIHIYLIGDWINDGYVVKLTSGKLFDYQGMIRFHFLVHGVSKKKKVNLEYWNWFFFSPWNYSPLTFDTVQSFLVLHFLLVG